MDLRTSPINDISGVQKHALDYLRSIQKDGLWGYLPGRESSLEVSAWAAIACRHDSKSLNDYINALLAKQNVDGGWSNEPLQAQSDWSTGAALLSLEFLKRKSAAESLQIQSSMQAIDAACRKAKDWLMDNRAERFSSAAKFVLLLWKGPEYDYERGWPWTKDTLDWVEPTSYVLLSLKNSQFAADTTVIKAVSMAERYLLRVVTPGGGWNCGDKLPIGVGYPPDVQTTSLALLALIQLNKEPRVEKSISWLKERMGTTDSIAEKAWAVLSLSAFDCDCKTVIGEIAKRQDKDGSFSKNVLTHTIACLSLELGSNPHLIA